MPTTEPPADAGANRATGGAKSAESAGSGPAPGAGAENRGPGPSKELEPPGEIGGDTIVETTAATAECPDLEDIAAFLDGRLPADRRALLIEHLAGCESCYEAYAGAASFLEEDSQTADSRQPEPLAPPGPFERPDRVGRRGEPQAPRWRGWWAAAVAALLAVAVGLLLVRWLGGAGGELSTERLASLVGGPAAASAVPWKGRVTRGPAEPADVPPDLQSFRLGVRFLDLRLTLAGGDREGADEALRRLNQLLEGIDFLPEETKEAYRQLRSAAHKPDVAPRSLLPDAAAWEAKGFKDLVEPRYVELGRWTEACRLAGVSGKPDLFRERATRRVLDQAVAPDTKEPSDLGPRAIEILSTLDQAVRAGRLDAAALGKRCQELLEQLDSD
jgi:hypothetical protein